MQNRRQNFDWLVEEAQKTMDFLDSEAANNLTHYEKIFFDDAVRKCRKSLEFIRTQRIIDYYMCVRCFLVKTGFHNGMCENCKEFYDYPTERKKKLEAERKEQLKKELNS